MNLAELETISDLDELIELSRSKPVFLFKHSTRCPISTFAQKEYYKHVQTADREKVEYTFLDLIAYRNVSNAIAEKTGVVHQSPQAILLVNGDAVWSDTHTQITESALAQAVNDYC